MDDKRWVGLTLRLKQEATHTLANNKSDGIAIVNAHVLMDSDGNPLVWVVSSKRVEPSRDARAILEQMLPSLD